MNHLPFKELLLTEEPLNPEQARSLQEHLRQCQDCQQIESAWNEVHNLFQRAPAATPAEGFTFRWQARLSIDSLARQRRTAWIVISITAGIALVLAVIFSLQVWQVLTSPATLSLVIISRLLVLLSYFSLTQDFLAGILNALPGAASLPVTLIILSLLVGFGSFLSVLWFTTFRQIIKVRRIIQ